MKRIIILLALVFSATACKDDFLDLAPQSEANVNDFFQTAEDYNAALISAYGRLQSYVTSYFELAEWRADNLLLDAPTAGTQDRYNIDQFVETSANGLILSAWGRFYNGILRANEIISRIPDANFDTGLKSQYEAEARFLRALAYFDTVRIWGEVPLVLEPISPDVALTTGRASLDLVYSAIEEDLQFAAQNLPAAHGAADLGRATSDAAWGLLGKVLLTQGKATEAVTAFRAVQGASLLADIDDVFDINNEVNAEILFAIRFNKDIDGEGHGHWFAVSDLSISPVRLNGAFEAGDAREDLLSYARSGNLFVLNKFADNLSGSTNSIGTDFVILRYADVLLSMAEALNEQGFAANGEAFDLLNQVRQRSGLAALTANEVPDQASFRRALAQERRVELALEGHRWFDLIRLGLAQEVISDNAGINIQDFQLLYPIPESEIEKINNADIFWQNPGY